jgi:hypothetical protein
MTDEKIRETLRRIRGLAEAILGPFAKEVEVEDPSGAILDGIVSPSLEAARDYGLLLDLEDLDEAIDDLLLLRAHARLTRERALGEEEPLAPEESQESPREPSRGSYGEAVVAALRERSGGVLPLSDSEP